MFGHPEDQIARIQHRVIEINVGSRFQRVELLVRDLGIVACAAHAVRRWRLRRTVGAAVARAKSSRNSGLLSYSCWASDTPLPAGAADCRRRSPAPGNAGSRARESPPGSGCLSRPRSSRRLLDRVVPESSPTRPTRYAQHPTMGNERRAPNDSPGSAPTRPPEATPGGHEDTKYVPYDDGISKNTPPQHNSSADNESYVIWYKVDCLMSPLCCPTVAA